MTKLPLHDLNTSGPVASPMGPPLPAVWLAAALQPTRSSIAKPLSITKCQDRYNLSDDNPTPTLRSKSVCKCQSGIPFTVVKHYNYTLRIFKIPNTSSTIL